MKTFTSIFVLLLCVVTTNAQDIYTSQNGKVTFHSETPVEDINAVSNKISSAVNNKTKQVYFKIQNTSFQFKEKLMEEHFNENYMESDKFPYSEFRGKILEDVDLQKNGKYNATLSGTLTMHGVIKEYKVPTLITVNNGVVTFSNSFKVKLKDHKIEIPSVVFTKIAEQIDIKLLINYKINVKK